MLPCLTALEAEAANTYAFATPQVFNWGDETYPPADHLDCQTYIGFITGLKGVLFYTFKDYDNNSTIDITQPDLFNACSQIADEVLNTKLKDAILFGKHEYYNIDYYRYYATWEYDGYLYLIAVNANDELTYDYSIDLPDFVVGSGENMFSYRPDSLNVNNGQLQGQLAPYQVAIYKFETNLVSTTQTSDGYKALRIYPNPGSYINIELPFESGILDVFSSDGVLMLTMNNCVNNVELDISEFVHGIYFVRVADPKTGYYTIKRIIKN